MGTGNKARQWTRASRLSCLISKSIWRGPAKALSDHLPRPPADHQHVHVIDSRSGFQQRLYAFGGIQKPK